MVWDSSLTVSIKAVNSRMIEVSPVDSKYEELSDNKIISLSFPDLKINIGDIITLNKKKYKINTIKKQALKGKNNFKYFLYTQEKITRTTTFIVPLLGHDLEYFRLKTDFVNAYVGTEQEQDYGEYLYLLYRFNGGLDFIKFEELLFEHPYYIKTIEVDNYHSLYKFKIPEYYKETVNKILEGKYSYISTEFKARIIKFHKTSIEKDIGQILTRNITRKIRMERELESKIPEGLDLLSTPKKEEEIFLETYKII